MISTAYRPRCETLDFVWRNETLRFRYFWPPRRPKRNGSGAQLASWPDPDFTGLRSLAPAKSRPSCAALERGSSKGEGAKKVAQKST